MRIATDFRGKPPVIIYANFGPYHIARLRALAAIMSDIVGIEISNTQELYSWCSTEQSLGFKCKTLFTGIPFESIPRGKQCKAIRQALSGFMPQMVVIAGYSEPVMRAAGAWARKYGVPTILLLVSTYLDHPRKWWKELAKRGLVRQYSAVAAVGQRAFDYARKLGMPENRVFQIGNVVDNAYFFNKSQGVSENKTEERKRRNLPEHYFLAVSRLSSEKNCLMLLQAFRNYRKQGGKWDLVVAGGGPMEQELFETVETYDISGVHFAGWQQYDELPAYYALASCFILPSISEPWGLVVNEAMACGLPVLVSQRCGCLPELCRSGVNGYDFAPCNAEQIAKLMLRMSSGEADLKAMGQASRQIIAEFTPAAWARKLKNGMDTTLART